MAKDKAPDVVYEQDGYTVEFRNRRAEIDAAVKHDGAIITELCYPKLRGLDPRNFGPEAVSIAKRKEAEKAG